MGKPVAFFEILSPNHERAQAFYRDLFDWQVPADPQMGEAGVKIYVRVDDLDSSLNRVEELGGKRLVPPMDLPGGFGRIAVFSNPDGNQVGLWA